VDGRDEIGGQTALDDVGDAARLQRGVHIIGILMHGEKHELRVAAGALQLTGHLDAVHVRHADIEHHHIGIELGRCCEQVQTVADRANNLKRAREPADSLRQHGGMVIRQQNAGEFG